MLQFSVGSSLRVRLRLLVTALVLAAFTAPGAAEAQRIKIEGQVWADGDGDGVRDAGEGPLAGVRVVLWRGDRLVDEALTDAEGRYRFRRLRSGLYKVRVDGTTLPGDLGLGPASFAERNFADVGSTAADFGFVPREVIARLQAAQPRPDPVAEEAGEAAPISGEPGDAGRLPGEPEQEEDAGRLADELEDAARLADELEDDELEAPAVPGEGADEARAAGEVEPGGAGEPAGFDDVPADRDRRGAAWWITRVPWLAWIVAVLAVLAGGLLGARRRRAVRVATLEQFLAHRDAREWAEMEAIYHRLPEAVRATALVRQQRAFGRNRAGEWQEAERLLRELLAEEGASPETCGILGRVYKDRWEEARDAGDESGAAELLERALAAYLQGHDSDPANAYPGINALTLMESYPSYPDRREPLLAAVRQAVAARTATEYWDHATALELAILVDDREAAADALAAAAAAPKNPWQVETSCRNLRLEREGRAARGEATPEWAREAEQELARAETQVPPRVGPTRGGMTGGIAGAVVAAAVATGVLYLAWGPHGGGAVRSSERAPAATAEGTRDGVGAGEEEPVAEAEEAVPAAPADTPEETATGATAGAYRRVTAVADLSTVGQTTTAACPAGTTLVGGGFRNAADLPVEVWYLGSWRGDSFDLRASATAGASRVTVTAICVDWPAAGLPAGAYQRVSEGGRLSDREDTVLTAECPAGSSLLGGGFRNQEGFPVEVFYSGPSGDGYALRGRGASPSMGVWVAAFCADLAAAPGPGLSYERVTETGSLTTTGATTITARCTGGRKVLGGGFRHPDGFPVEVFGSGPTAGDGYEFRGRATSGSPRVTVTALCADLG